MTTGERTSGNDLARRTVWPSWLSPASVLAAFSVLGPATYVCLYAYAVGYFYELGLTPEDVGVDQASLLVRGAGMALVVAVLLLFTLPVVVVASAAVLLALRSALRETSRFVVFVVAETLGARRQASLLAWWDRDDHLWAASGPGRVRRWTWLTTIACATILVAVGSASSSWTGGNGATATTTLFTAVLAIAAIGPLAAWRHAAAVAATTVITLGLLVLASLNAGSRAGAEALTHREPDSVADLLGLSPQEVCIVWTGGEQPTWAPAGPVVLIGSNGSSFLLAVDSDLLTVSADLVDAVITPRSPGAAPSC